MLLVRWITEPDMAIESEYRELFSESVTLLPPVSMDKYGRRTHSGSAASIAAHLVAENSLSRDQDGREVVETGKVYLYGSHNVTTDYLIVLPDGSSPVIIAVDTPHDQNGAHHTVVRVGR
jgi:hypothetical protein